MISQLLSAMVAAAFSFALVSSGCVAAEKRDELAPFS
jgi:hypothetical protein